jgi:hypothetical protein
MTDTQTIVSQYRELQAELKRQIKEAQDNIRTQAQGVLKSVFADFFVKYPDVYAIGWTQYTPYFNDGDACIFRVGEICLYLSQASYDNGSLYEGDQDILRWGGADDHKKIEAVGGEERYKDIVSQFEEIGSLVEEVGKLYLEMLYGDHAAVLYTKDGLTVSQFDHD